MSLALRYRFVSTQRFARVLASALALTSAGCASSLAQPFDQMRQSGITVYRLQNFEAPPTALSASPTFALPPQIQQWVTAGAAMLPPGLLPPGLVPGATPAQPDVNAARFHGFRILGWAPITDARQRDEVIDVLGHESSFVVPRDTCMYAEFGLSIAQASGQPADVLVSLSCNQLQSAGFQWPYVKNGLTPDGARRLVSVMQRAFTR